MKINPLVKSFSYLFTFCLIIAFSKDSFSYTFPRADDYTDTSKKTEVDCKSIMQGKTMVALVFGQSNSANSGETLYTPKGNVYNFFNGKCYVASDPLLGTSGGGGSVWTRLGDKLIGQGLYENVILVSIGVGGTEIRRWTVSGDLHRRILDVIFRLKKKHIKITHMLWHQGESDKARKTSNGDYMRMFMDMLNGIRKHGIDAPIYVSVATRCGGGGAGYEIQQAQKELVNTDLKIFPGPDTDKLNTLDDRHDACHFSNSGLEKHAELWLQAIKFSEQ